MAKEKIETLAVLDYLTLLPNRSGLYSFYSGLSIQEYVPAMFLDIDNFKRVNDTYGHQVGDELLKAVTKDLQEIVPDAYIARIGGDEFVILIIGQREKHEILEVAEEICDSVERLAVSPEVRSVISLSVGVLQRLLLMMYCSRVIRPCITRRRRVRTAIHSTSRSRKRWSLKQK